MNSRARIPPLNEEAAYIYVYALGTLARKGVSAVLTKSPYMRRLELVRYFGDLPGVLETTYQQHIQGTAEIMRSYVKMISALKANVFKVFIEVTTNTDNEMRRRGREILKVFDWIHQAYTRELAETALLPSLLGMLAVPPYRRPLGTYMKRLYMKALQDELNKEVYTCILDMLTGEMQGQEDRCRAADDSFAKILTKLRDNLLDFYEKILKSKHIGFIPELHTLLGRIRLDNITVQKLEEEYREKFLETLKKMYSIRLTPFDLDNDYVIDTIVIMPRKLFALFSLPAAFILRYRTLGTALGVGYVIVDILERLKVELKEQETSKDLVKRLKTYLNEIMRLIDAMLVNHSSTVITPRELVKITHNGSKTNNYTYVMTPLGLNNIVETSTDLEEHVGQHPLFDENACEFHENINVYKCIKGVHTSTFNGLWRNDFEKYYIAYVDDAYYVNYGSIDGVYCCLLRVLDEESETKASAKLDRMALRENINPYSLLELALHLLVELGPWPDPELMKLEPDGYIVGLFSPFLSHFDLELIQADMVPSAYQLDLINRLDKDVNLGMRISPQYLRDLVFNIDNYSLLVFSLLNVLYTFLFKDVVALSSRTSLLLRASEPYPTGAGNGIVDNAGDYVPKRIDVYTLTYFRLLANEYEKLATKIEDKVNEVNEISEEMNIENGELQALLDAFRSYSEHLKNYAELLKRLTDIVIGKYARGEEERINAIREELENLEKKFGTPLDQSSEKPPSGSLTSLIDSHVENIFLGTFSDKSAKNGDKAARLLLHGVISIQDLFQEFLVNTCNHHPNNCVAHICSYNRLAYQLTTKLQTIIGVTFRQAILEELNKHLENFIQNQGCNNSLEARIIDMSYQLPTQGIIKPYFHLPMGLSAAPRVLDALDTATLGQKYRDQIESRAKELVHQGYNGLTVNVLARYIVAPDLEKIIKNLKNERLGFFQEIQAPFTPHAHIKITPDTVFWNILGPSDESLERYPQHECGITQSPAKRPKLFYNTSYILYSFILEIRKKDNNPSKSNDRYDCSHTLANLEHIITKQMSNLLIKYIL